MADVPTRASDGCYRCSSKCASVSVLNALLLLDRDIGSTDAADFLSELRTGLLLPTLVGKILQTSLARGKYEFPAMRRYAAPVGDRTLAEFLLDQRSGVFLASGDSHCVVIDAASGRIIDPASPLRSP